MPTMDDDEKLILAFRELHAELLALGGDQGRETTYSRAADRLSALRAERDRMAAALREIDKQRYANRQTISPDNAYEAAVRLNDALVRVYDIARAALSQEPTPHRS